MNVPWDVIRKVVCEFQAVPHRIEFVKEVNGVKYYNDSKGTNPDAAIKAVEAMVRPTIVIGGGYDKESVYDEWICIVRNESKKSGYCLGRQQIKSQRQPLRRALLQ